MEFSEWITQKYVTWRGDAVGRERTITEFAAHIGVPQPLMSRWMTPGGHVPKTFDAIQKLAEHYGEEVFDVLGIPITEDQRMYWEWHTMWQLLTPEQLEELHATGVLKLTVAQQNELKKQRR